DKLNAGVAKKCGPDVVDASALFAADGLAFGADAEACAARGVASLTTLDDLLACIRFQHQCEANQVLENEIPRLYELLDLGGVTLPWGRAPRGRLGCAPGRVALASPPVTAPRATGRATALAVAALTIVAALLRFGSLGRSLWLDEAWRANIAVAPT